MTPKTLTVLAAAALAGSIAAVELARDECVDAVVVSKGESGYEKALQRICEGDAPLPDGSEVVWASAVKSTKPLIGEVTKAPTVEEVVGGCACGPVAKSDCVVTLAEMDGKVVTRAARAGEHLHGGTWSGACPRKNCVEVSAVDALGSAQPAACGGANFGTKAATAAVEAKAIADPAVEAGEVKAP